MTDQPETPRFDKTVPSVHEFQTDIDLSEPDYEPVNAASVIFPLVTCVLTIISGIIWVFLDQPVVTITSFVAAAISGFALVRAERAYRVIDARNRARFNERIALARPIALEQFGFEIPDDFEATWVGARDFTRKMALGVIPVQDETLVLSVGPSPLLLLRFYPMG